MSRQDGAWWGQAGVSFAFAAVAVFFGFLYFVGFEGEHGACNSDDSTAFKKEFPVSEYGYVGDRAGDFSLLPPGRVCEALAPAPYPREGPVVATAVFPKPLAYVWWALFILSPFLLTWLWRWGRAAWRRFRR